MKLEIENLTKYFGEFAALNNLNYTFEPGIYGILGTNGAGKSTMMNLLTDNLPRDSGRILFNGTDILKMGKEWRKNIGYMPQQQGFYEHMTAESFLFYIAELKGLRKKQARSETDYLLDVTGLTSVRHKKLGGFSGGMKQRVLLAQAMLGSPRVIILDEPTAGLDPKERIRIRNFISSISQKRIVLLATHIVSDIESISDQILMMKHGTLVGSGTPEELLDSVADKVCEVSIYPEDAEKWQQDYKVGSLSVRHGKMTARIIGDRLPENGHLISNRLTLEDVYLYYLD